MNASCTHATHIYRHTKHHTDIHTLAGSRTHASERQELCKYKRRTQTSHLKVIKQTEYTHSLISEF